ncbi:extracellular matrix protein 3-like [Patiria miniata]|uniref:Cadherin domain-containing protein n=1 Tax=Patiria miniata TaxID=46514 RepID=A0A913ZFU8_PATMI|nr:extracellular matrix protein 3-like [Patiria miniata]
MIASRILVLAIAVVALTPVVHCQTYNLKETSYTVLENATHVIVEITRSGPVDVATSVLVTTLPGTASSPGDYTVLNQQREFIMNSRSLTVRIDIMDDDLREQDEYFFIQISNLSNADTIGSNSMANITILDDDAEFKFERSSYPLVSESEGSITIAVVRDGYLNKEANVYISTSEGDHNDATRATPGVDFNRLVETRLQFLANLARIEVVVGIIQDQTPEETELLDVQIVRVDGGQVGNPSSTTLSISDDDVEYAIAQESFSTKESPGSTQIIVTITRRINTNDRSTIWVYTEDGTATASSRDYIVYSNRVEFLPGASSATVTITVLDDNEYEPVPEVFYVGIRDPEPSGFVLAGASKRPITIEDNESIFSLLKTAYTVKESDESVTVEIRRTGDQSQQTSVRVRSIAVSATAGQDYANVDQELTFAANQVGVNLVISILNDDVTGEEDEVFIVELYQASISILDSDKSSARITIQDSPRLSTLAIVLIAVGCAIFVILILIMLLCCCAFMRPSGPREPFYYDRGRRGVPGVDFPQEQSARGPVVTHIPDELDDRRRERQDWPHRRSERRINGSAIQNGGPRITELNERDHEPRRESNRHASNDQPPPPPPPAQERLPEGRNEPEPSTDRHGESSDPRRTRSMFNPQGEREPYWAKARHSYHSSPNHYGYF